MARKPHPSSVLKTLPDEDQAALFEFLRDKTLAEGVQWLFSNNGLRTNDSSLSDWRGWYAMNRTIDGYLSDVDELKIKLADIGTDPDLIPKIGEAVFLGKAAKTGDAKMFATVAAITQRHTELKSRQGEHADKMKIADKRLKLQAANLDRQNKELQSRLDELDRQRKAAEAAITKANKDGGMTDETVKVIRQALGMKTDEA
jgi:hypothetical protein